MATQVVLTDGAAAVRTAVVTQDAGVDERRRPWPCKDLRTCFPKVALLHAFPLHCT
jgi:hypothetical protein